MTLVTIEDINARLDTPLDLDDARLSLRVSTLIDDAEEAIDVAFMKAGRSWESEMQSIPWLESESKRVIRQMVSAAIAVGPNAGVRSVSSTTGPQSDSVTFADAIDWVTFGGVKLTEEQKRALGLIPGGRPKGSFPPPLRWPEVNYRG
ncbi:Gp19/Gp15/Gp42 family protein [Corynebacterium cystitidis]|uniref:Gp19/Gp15/Gp42 family protein n=1 Tax=Corynebacterium cystitidis TaxID=35757 RepID=UPI00211E6BA0|nr:Gp19/Gp15/Gp42 family protein [Corynebacterium cystitidis]